MEQLFRVTGDCLKARTSFLKMVTGLLLLEWFSELVSDFVEASRNFVLHLLYKNQPKIVKNHQPEYKKY
jgi:hypothetical protein